MGFYQFVIIQFSFCQKTKSFDEVIFSELKSHRSWKSSKILAGEKSTTVNDEG
jgi:hypothetical protein